MYKIEYYRCECASEVITLEKYEGEDDLFLSVYHLFDRNASFFERLVHSINILLGRKSLISSVVLSKETAKKLGNEMNNMANDEVGKNIVTKFINI